MGTRLGRYEVIRTLARGSLTDLLLGRATGEAGFQRHVAIKLLREEHAQDPACLEMFVNEARLAATLHHHNIVQVLDIGDEAGQPFFAMEYVHGVDLRKLLGHLGKRQEQLPLQHVVSIIAAAAAALHHAHDQRGPDGAPLGIVHRQVTPGNLLVGFDGNVKIVDFGIAKAAIKRIQTGVGVLKGSAPYMAPEQCAGRTIDRRSDVFALGIVLYELATVRRLFKGANEFLTMSAVVNADIPRPSRFRRDVPGELEVVMLKALARDPLARYQTAHDMANALDRVARAVGVGASTTALANYLKLQFGERKEPWLEAKVEMDPETTDVDFDGSASGLAPPPTEALKSNAIPRDVAATKSSPIAQARTIVMTPAARSKSASVPPSASATIPMDKSFQVSTTVDDLDPEPASSRKSTSVGGDVDDEPPTDVIGTEPDSKSTTPMPKLQGTIALTLPAAAQATVGAQAPTIALKVNPLAATEPAALAQPPSATPKAAVAKNAASASAPASSAAGASAPAGSPPATVALHLPASGVSPKGLPGAQHARTAVASPPPPPDSVEVEGLKPARGEVQITDATAIVEPLAVVVARAHTVTGTRSKNKMLYIIGGGAAALLLIVGAIVFWPSSDPAASSASPVTENEPAKDPEDKEPAKSAMDMTARDYEAARADAAVAEVAIDAAAEVVAEATADAALEADALAEAKAKAEAEAKAKEEAEAKAKEEAEAKADAKIKDDAKAVAAKTAKRSTKKTTATKRTPPVTKKKTTAKKKGPKWDPDDLFLGE